MNVIYDGNSSQKVGIPVKVGKVAALIHTIYDRAVLICWVLETGQCKDSLNANNGEDIPHTLQHTLVDTVIQLVIYLRVLTHLTQQFVHQLAHPEPHRLIAGIVVLNNESMV